MEPSAREPTPTANAVAAAAQALDRVASFLRRFSRRVAVLAVAGLVGGAAIGVVAVSETPAENRLAVAIILGVVLAIPPVVLGLFAIAVRALVQLPQRIRESPEAVRGHADDLATRARAVGEARSAGRIRTLAAVVRLVRTAGSTRDLLGSILPGAFLFNPARLLGTALAAAGAIVEVVLGAIAIVWLLVA
jgi:hypothetical protein